MKVIDRNIALTDVPQLFDGEGVVALKSEELGASEYEISIKSQPDDLVALKWKIPCFSVKGVWTTNALHEKRLRADWELPVVQSRISVDAPMICVYDHLDNNLITFALSDYIHTTELEASIQEEDGHIYCIVRLLVEPLDHQADYSCTLRVITDDRPYYAAIQDIEQWWARTVDTANVPPLTTVPVYSTWYSYHQNFTADQLIDECKRAKELGYGGIIVDDGWQTHDGGRGYDFTGDWEVERIPDVHDFVSQIKEMGMYCMFWMSVPFCGIKSKAYQRFKGKFLTEDHPWAPVFDPRYVEVRAHLVSRYVEAIRDWRLDGLKLDFIDDFKVYPDTDMTIDGKDCLSVNEGVKRLIDEAKQALYAINPNVLIEFRQKYSGPYLQTLGNMFRAFDCPYDSLTNRIRTADVKMLTGDTVVHSDMIAWHGQSDVEHAALQLSNILFSVPQLSVRLGTTRDDHLQMIRHYTMYWSDHKHIFLKGQFVPQKPSSNYPILSSSADNHIIYGVYEDMLLEVDCGYMHIHIVNGKMTEQVLFEVFENMENADVTIVDCLGEIDWQERVTFEEGVLVLEVPANGIIKITQTHHLNV